MHHGEVHQQRQQSLFILTLIGLSDLDGAILITVMVILITHIMDMDITLGTATQVTDGADTLVMVGVDTLVMAITTLTQRLTPIIIAEEVLLMEEITTEQLLMQATLSPTETVHIVETVYTAGIT